MLVDMFLEVAEEYASPGVRVQTPPDEELRSVVTGGERGGTPTPTSSAQSAQSTCSHLAVLQDRPVPEVWGVRVGSSSLSSCCRTVSVRGANPPL